MADYILNRSDPVAQAAAGNPLNGEILVEHATFNTDTSLTIPGQTQPEFGDAIGENFLHMLENFASTTAPITPIRGQLWFDMSISELMVNVSITDFTGSWVPVSAGGALSSLQVEVDNIEAASGGIFDLNGDFDASAFDPPFTIIDPGTVTDLNHALLFLDIGVAATNTANIAHAAATSVHSLLNLSDVPASSYSGQDGKVLTVDETGGQIIFSTPAGGGATDLTDLDDVNALTPAVGSFLKFTDPNWEPATIPGGITTLAALDDTNVVGPIVDQILAFTTVPDAKWRNIDIDTLNIARTGGATDLNVFADVGNLIKDNLTDLADVDIVGEVSNEMLAFIGGKWINRTVSELGLLDAAGGLALQSEIDAIEQSLGLHITIDGFIEPNGTYYSGNFANFDNVGANSSLFDALAQMDAAITSTGTNVTKTVDGTKTRFHWANVTNGGAADKTFVIIMGKNNVAANTLVSIPFGTLDLDSPPIAMFTTYNTTITNDRQEAIITSTSAFGFNLKNSDTSGARDIFWIALGEGIA